MLESTAPRRSAKLNRAHESEIIQQHRQENNGEISYAAAYEVLSMRRAPGGDCNDQMF